MSNPFLEGEFLAEEDVVAFNKFGMTLTRLGVVTNMWMELEEYEDVAPGCGCGGCYIEDYHCGVAVHIGDEVYEEYDIR